ncbi:MAG: SBBP repeat-containing protein [Trueperaceae bacterium]|nr:SBBP repeat-containing protein [Trueperaceae bacterium]
MIMQRTGFAIFVILPVLLAVGCGPSGPSGPSGVSAVIVEPDEVELVVGEHHQLDATVDAAGNASEEVTWSSDDASVATVNEAGHVSAVAEGSATVTATSVADPSIADDVRVEVFVEGALRWTKLVETHMVDEIGAIAVDGADDVLVGGATAGDMGDATAGALGGGGGGEAALDAYVRKLDAGGDEVWTHQFGTSHEDEVARAGLATDGENAVLVGATVGGPVGTHVGGQDALLRKLDATGEVVWTRQFGTSDADNVRSVAVGREDAVVVAGETRGDVAAVNAGQTDVYVRKFDADGTTLWTRQFGSGTFDGVWGVAVDATGHVFVAGDTNGALAGPSAGGWDLWVRRLDPDGTTLWTRQFGTPANEYVSGIAVDPNGHVLLTGSTEGTLGASHAGGSDVFVRRLHPEGTHLWTRQFGTAASEVAGGVATDSEEHVIVVGGTQGDLAGHAGGEDGFVRKMDAEGEEVWRRQFGSEVEEVATGVAVDGKDWILVATQVSGTLASPLSGQGHGVVSAYMR